MGPRWSQELSTWSQHGPQDCQLEAKMTTKTPNLEPRLPKTPQLRAKRTPKTSNLDPKCHPTWMQHANAQTPSSIITNLSFSMRRLFFLQIDINNQNVNNNKLVISHMASKRSVARFSFSLSAFSVCSAFRFDAGWCGWWDDCSDNFDGTVPNALGVRGQAPTWVCATIRPRL